MLKKNNNKEIGKYGENLAVKYLVSRGYKILDRNFMCRLGEIDIIANFKTEYIFVEVKTRRNKNYGAPIDSVNTAKVNHIYNTAKYYLYKNYLMNESIRFDIIEIYIKNKKVYLRHTKNVMW